MVRPGHLRHLAVLSFWLVSLGCLVYREAWFPWVSQRGILERVRVSAAGAPMAREDWKGIYADKTKIGYLHEMSRPAVDPPGGSQVSQEGRVVLSMLGERRDLFFTSDLTVDADGQIVRSSSVLQFWPAKISVDGIRKGRFLHLTVSQGKAQWTTVVPLPENAISLETVSRLVAAGKLQKGERLKLVLLDPFSLHPGEVELLVQGRRLFYMPGRNLQATVLEVRYQGLSTTRWIGDDGTVLQEESPWGWTLRQEEAEKAAHIDLADWAHPPDLLAMVAVPTEVWIQQPRQVKLLQVAVHRPDRAEPEVLTLRAVEPPESSPQRPIRDPAFTKELSSTPFIQVDDPAIQRSAKTVVGSETNSWAAARKINDWIYRSLRKAPTLGLPISTEVLRRMEGDCNEHTCLYVALARASGIPCRIVMGLVYFDGAFVYHTWPKVYVGRWVELDPTLGQAPVDATHVPLMEADLEESVRMAPFVGKIQLKVQRYE